jgi:hypothetical protein
VPTSNHIQPVFSFSNPPPSSAFRGLFPATLTFNGIKALAHRRREYIERAYATGALRACSVAANRKGRTPGVLFAADEVMRWMAAGCPVGVANA